MNAVDVFLGLLKDERDLLEKAAALERKKHDAILKADGKQLQELTLESETLLAQIHELETKRDDLLAFDGHVSTTTLIEAVESFSEQTPRSRPALEKAAQEFRESARLLSSEIETNRRLLEVTRGSIDRVIESLRDEANPGAADGYSPGRKGRDSARSSSVLLNANA